MTERAKVIGYNERRDLLKEARAMARLAFRAKGSSDPAVVRRARQVVARYDDKQESAISTRRKEHEATYANVRYVIMVTAHRDEAVRMLHALRISFEKGA